MKHIPPYPLVQEAQTTTFTITIADSFATYSYPFEIREDTSIAEIAKGIAERFQTSVPKGTLISLKNCQEINAPFEQGAIS